MKKLYPILFLSFFLSCSEEQPDIVPVPDFTASKGNEDIYAGEGFALYNLSERTESITWDFGDGNTSTDSVVVHTYPSPGEYDVTLTACHTGNCLEIQKTIHVKDSLQSLLTANDSLSYQLVRWINGQGDEVIIDECLTCKYGQTFYNDPSTPRNKGLYRYHNQGVRACSQDTIVCNSYGPEGYANYELDLDPHNEFNIILINGRGYGIRVDENQLTLKGSLLEELHYIRQ